MVIDLNLEAKSPEKKIHPILSVCFLPWRAGTCFHRAQVKVRVEKPVFTN